MVAPLVDPYTAISDRSRYEPEGITYVRLSDRELPVRYRETIDTLAGWRPKSVLMPTLAVMGDADGIEKPENLTRIVGPNVSRNVLPGVSHDQTT
jgi:hypothetical protein